MSSPTSERTHRAGHILNRDPSRLKGNGQREDRLTLEQSFKNYDQAKQVMPGGTTRVTVKRMPVPIYVERGEGAYLIDVDGNRYLDFAGNYTVSILGHAFEPVASAIKEQLDLGSCYANPTHWDIKLAKLLTDRVPAVEKIRFTNSGTEAVMFAVKGARAFTGKSKIAKLEGAYHGAYDWVEVSEASTPDNWGQETPNSTPYYEGMPKSVLTETVIIPQNDVVLARRILEENAADLSCLLIDLMPSRAGLIPLTPDFIEMISTLCRKHGIVLISDEVLNFRYGYEGISAALGLKPDIITLGKIIGGGLPIGAFGGSDEVMSVFDSSSGIPKVRHGGTFAANPLSMVAGLTAMEHMTGDAFAHLNSIGEYARDGLRQIIADRRLALSVCGLGSMFRVHLAPKPPTSYREAWLPPLASTLHHELGLSLAAHGVMMPSDTSACCSVPMTKQDIDFFLDAFKKALDGTSDFGERVNASYAQRQALLNIQS